VLLKESYENKVYEEIEKKLFYIIDVDPVTGCWLLNSKGTKYRGLVREYIGAAYKVKMSTSYNCKKTSSCLHPLHRRPPLVEEPTPIPAYKKAIRW